MIMKQLRELLVLPRGDILQGFPFSFTWVSFSNYQCSFIHLCGERQMQGQDPPGRGGGGGGGVLHGIWWRRAAQFSKRCNFLVPVFRLSSEKESRFNHFGLRL